MLVTSSARGPGGVKAAKDDGRTGTTLDDLGVFVALGTMDDPTRGVDLREGVWATSVGAALRRREVAVVRVRALGSARHRPRRLIRADCILTADGFRTRQIYW